MRHGTAGHPSTPKGLGNPAMLPPRQGAHNAALTVRDLETATATIVAALDRLTRALTEGERHRVPH